MTRASRFIEFLQAAKLGVFAGCPSTFIPLSAGGTVKATATFVTRASFHIRSRIGSKMLIVVLLPSLEPGSVCIGVHYNRLRLRSDSGVALFWMQHQCLGALRNKRLPLWQGS